jgi:hypothetical protein
MEGIKAANLLIADAEMVACLFVEGGEEQKKM